MSNVVPYDEFIERKILDGLITSQEYTEMVRPYWRDDLIESPEIRRVAEWALEYFDKHGQVPDHDIETIYMEQQEREKIDKATREFLIEMLSRLSDDHERLRPSKPAWLFVRRLGHRQLLWCAVSPYHRI